jgi:hypothetical protein
MSEISELAKTVSELAKPSTTLADSGKPGLR